MPDSQYALLAFAVLAIAFSQSEGDSGPPREEMHQFVRDSGFVELALNRRIKEETKALESASSLAEQAFLMGGIESLKGQLKDLREGKFKLPPSDESAAVLPVLTTEQLQFWLEMSVGVYALTLVAIFWLWLDRRRLVKRLGR